MAESKAKMKEIEEIGVSCAGLLVDAYSQLDRMQMWRHEHGARLRLNNICVHGIEEGVEKEDIKTFMETFIK